MVATLACAGTFTPAESRRPRGFRGVGVLLKARGKVVPALLVPGQLEVRRVVMPLAV